MKTKNGALNEYVRVMTCLDIDEEAKKRIINNCARYSTMKKLRAGKFRIIAVKKETFSEL